MDEENSAINNFIDDGEEYPDGYEDETVDPPGLVTETIDPASGDSSGGSSSGSGSSIIAEQVIEVNLTPGGVYPVIRVSQYDNGYQIRFKIYHGNELLDLSRLSVKFYLMKKNGHAYTDNLTVVANTIGQAFFWVSSAMTDVAGDHFCELSISNTSGRTIGTANMVLVVEPGIILRSPATVTTDTINDLHAAVQLVSRITAYEQNLDVLAASTEYSRTWTYGNSFGGQEDNHNYCIVWRSGYAVTVTFAATCTSALTVAADNRAIIKNLPKARHRVYLSIPVIHFTHITSLNKWVPDSIKGMCICTIRPSTSDASAAAQLQTDGALNPTSVDVGDVLYGTFSYITSEPT